MLTTSVYFTCIKLFPHIVYFKRLLFYHEDWIIMHTKIYEEMHVSLPPLQQSNSFKYKQKSKKKNKEKIRFKMYDFDFVILTYKHLTSS